jgi:hypothetical protein
LSFQLFVFPLFLFVLTCRLADGKARFGCFLSRKAFKKPEKAQFMIKKQRTAKQKVVNDKNLTFKTA